MFDILLIIVAAVCLVSICFLCYSVRKCEHDTYIVMKELQAEVAYYVDENMKLAAKNIRYAMEVDKLNKKLKESQENAVKLIKQAVQKVDKPS